MIRVFLPFLVLFAANCQESDPQAGVAPSPEPPVIEPKPLEPIVGQKDRRYVPQRIHQLKDLATRTIKFNGHVLTVWIMDRDSTRAEGMMWLKPADVKDTEGMLFVFKDAQPRSFWMQNCPLSLDITYLDAKGKVLNTVVGKPFNESGLPSKGSAQYVLELKVGLAKKFGIKPGSVLNLPKDVKAKE